jgi:hypothetical protein
MTTNILHFVNFWKVEYIRIFFFFSSTLLVGR